MRIFRDFMRFVALVVGLLAGLVGIIVDIVYVIGSHVQSVSSHGGLGFLAIVIGIVGALAAPFNGVVAAVLMVISLIAFFIIVGPIAAFSGVLFLIAAALAFFDRYRRTQIRAA